MGLFDSLSNIFLQDREGDFVKLEEHEEEYGPGPAVVLYNVPTNLLDDELTDMLEDGAPKATKKGISMTRIITAGGVVNEDLLDLSVQEALERVVSSSKSLSSSSPPSLLSTDAGILSTCPVLLFSGFSNKEMMDSYNIIAEEIYKEMAGQAIMAACAKAVPNAMLKPLRQMLQEICGDHQDAMRQDDF